MSGRPLNEPEEALRDYAKLKETREARPDGVDLSALASALGYPSLTPEEAWHRLVPRIHAAATALAAESENASADTAHDSALAAFHKQRAQILQALFRLAPRWVGLSLTQRRDQLAHNWDVTRDAVRYNQELKAYTRVLNRLHSTGDKAPRDAFAELSTRLAVPRTDITDMARALRMVAQGDDISESRPAIEEYVDAKGERTGVLVQVISAAELLYRYAALLLWLRSEHDVLIELTKACDDSLGDAPVIDFLGADEEGRAATLERLKKDGAWNASQLAEASPFDAHEKSLLRGKVAQLVTFEKEPGLFLEYLETDRRGRAIFKKWEDWLARCRCADAERLCYHHTLALAQQFLYLLDTKYHTGGSGEISTPIDAIRFVEGDPQ